MSLQNLMLKGHPVQVEPYGGSATVAVDSSGGTIYYADNNQVSASSSQGTISPGSSQAFTSNVWITAAGVLTPVTITTTSVWDEWATVNPASIGGVVPTGQEWINVLATPFSNSHFNTVVQSSADYFGGELQSDGTQNAQVTFQKYLQAGTYTMDVFQKTGATHGIITIIIDGVTLGTTIDTWAASGAETRSTIANIAISGSTVHSIQLLMATHNASATTPFYLGVIHGIALTRTGS